MPELWFGPDGSLDFSAVPDGDPDSILPILPIDELAALHEALRGSERPPTAWDPRAMGFTSEGDDGDALAAAMGGVHHDGLSVESTSEVDDLIDPWVAEPDAFVLGHPLL
jgi:hypothetical protein